MAESADLIRVGVITKPHGTAGEVSVKLLTDFPTRFQKLSSVILIPINGHEHISAKIIQVRDLGSTMLLKFAGIDSRTKARGIVNHEIAIPETERVQPPEGSYYGYELIGLSVEVSDGTVVGTVKDVLSYPAQDVLVVAAKDGSECLIPFVSEICPEVSLAGRRIVITHLPGLIGFDDDEN
jgi:16S rRNA processing protein RimM